MKGHVGLQVFNFDNPGLKKFFLWLWKKKPCQNWLWNQHSMANWEGDTNRKNQKRTRPKMKSNQTAEGTQNQDERICVPLSTIQSWERRTKKVVFLTLNKLFSRKQRKCKGPTKDQNLKKQKKELLQLTPQGISWSNELKVKRQMGLWVINLEYPGLKKLVFLALNKLFSKKQMGCHSKSIGSY